MSLHLDAGQITQEAPAGCPEGTTILVRDLFYNTPARMKFMKSDQAEASAVFLAVQQQALAHPEIAFRFLKDGAEQLSTSGSGDRMSAIYTVFGRELSNSMVEVNGNWEQFTVRGFVTKRAATARISIFSSIPGLSNRSFSRLRWSRRIKISSWSGAFLRACWSWTFRCRRWT